MVAGAGAGARPAAPSAPAPPPAPSAAAAAGAAGLLPSTAGKPCCASGWLLPAAASPPLPALLAPRPGEAGLAAGGGASGRSTSVPCAKLACQARKGCGGPQVGGQAATVSSRRQAEAGAVYTTPLSSPCTAIACGGTAPSTVAAELPVCRTRLRWTRVLGCRCVAAPASALLLPLPGPARRVRWKKAKACSRWVQNALIRLKHVVMCLRFYSHHHMRQNNWQCPTLTGTVHVWYWNAVSPAAEALTSAPATPATPSSTPASSVRTDASSPVGKRMAGSECSR